MTDIHTDFLIRPLTALFFGQPRSFFAGESHRSVSMFPPPQSAFQGMVRSQLLRAAGLDFQREKAQIETLVGKPDALPPGWQLQGVFPAQVTERDGARYLQPWLPSPRYLLRSEDGLVCAKPVSAGLPVMASMGRQRDPVVVGRPERGEIEGVAGGWLAPPLLRALLAGEIDEWQCPDDCQWQRPWPSFVHRESRPGLGLRRGDEVSYGDKRAGVAAHGMLYFLDQLRVQQKRGQPAGFYGRLDAPGANDRIPADALRQSLGMAGRKGMPVAFESTPPLDDDWQAIVAGGHLPDTVSEAQRFWLIAMTPVRPDKVWSPLREALPEGVTLQVEAVLAGKMATFGGLRMADRRSRTNRSFFPGGTSWLVRLRGGDDRSRAKTLRILNASHPMGSSAEASFGHGFILVGICKEDMA